MRQDAKNNRMKIEQKARELFKSHGVAQVTMNNLAKELNMGTGTLYRHFEDKSALCYELTIEDFNELFKHMETLETLEQYITAFVYFKEEHSELMACIEERSNQNRSTFKSSKAYQTLHHYFFNYYQSRTDDAAFRTDILLNALSITNYHYLRNIRQLSPDDIIQRLERLFDC